MTRAVPKTCSDSKIGSSGAYIQFLHVESGITPFESFAPPEDARDRAVPWRGLVGECELRAGALDQRLGDEGPPARDPACARRAPRLSAPRLVT